MSTTAQMEVSKLNLDLKNFRTTPQKNEPNAIKVTNYAGKIRIYKKKCRKVWHSCW